MTIIIGINGNLHQRMSTGGILTHGVSGMPCLGRAGDFQTQRRGEPWENIVNDPIVSYLNAQSHIGIPISNFNEPWTGGALQDGNWGAAPYRTPLIGPIQTGENPSAPFIEVAPVEYPSILGKILPQQMPSATIHSEVSVPEPVHQSMMGDGSLHQNGDNRVFLPHAMLPTVPNTAYFQGSSVSTGVHPANDKAGQTTAPNTARPEFTQGQTPFQKLPGGQTVGQMQPGEAPALWQYAPPPDPLVLPREGTGALQPTAPQWW